MKAVAVGLFLSSALGLCHGQSIQPIAPEKGAFSLGLSFSYLNGGGSSVSLLEITPAYFVTDRVEVRLPFAADRGINADETVIGLGIRAHFGRKHSLFDPFLGIIAEHAGAGSGFREDFFGALIGANYFVANNVAIQGVFQLGSDRTGGPDQSTANLAFGFVVFFVGK